MSKNKSKSPKAGRPPTPPPQVFLRQRLDALWHAEALADQDSETMIADINRLAQGIKPEFLLSTLIAAYRAAPPRSQAYLDEALPTWLGRSGLVETLETMVSQETLAEDAAPYAVAWLAHVGRDTTALTRPAPLPLFRAYRRGNEFQASLQVFWYVDQRYSRVQGMGFLIDYNPPWEGALKDAFAFPQSSPQEATARVEGTTPGDPGTSQRIISGEQAKREIITALLCNRQQGIRLPADLIPLRDMFVRSILRLPDTTETPPFTAADFDALARQGASPERLSDAEQRYGYITRLPGGEMGVLKRLADE